MALSKEAKKLRRKICCAYEMNDAELKILDVALQAYDRAQEAKKIIDDEGLIIHDRFGQPKPHPLCQAERDSRSAFLTGMRQLNLPDTDDKEKRPGRPSEFERYSRKERRKNG